MFKRHFIFRFLGTLLFIGLLIAGGAAAFHAGQSQGYVQGLAASGAQLTAPIQEAPNLPGVMPGYFGPMGLHRPHFFPFFGIGLALFFFFVVGGFFRMMSFRHWMHHAQMQGHGPWNHGMHQHPCEKPSETTTSDTPPAAETKQ
jgi:hypothetical protein